MRDPLKQQQGKTCDFDGCDDECLSRGYCSKHYRRLRHSGELPVLALTTEERFWLKVNRSDDCWLWRAATRDNGYPEFWDGRMVSAHVFAYRLENDAPPPGYEVDHRCRNIICVRPSHLRLATRKQNMENRVGATSRSKTGIRGVTNPRPGIWYASVVHHGKVHSSRHSTLDEAVEAVVAMRLRLFTHSEADREAV